MHSSTHNSPHVNINDKICNLEHLRFPLYCFLKFIFAGLHFDLKEKSNHFFFHADSTADHRELYGYICILKVPKLLFTFREDFNMLNSEV